MDAFYIQAVGFMPKVFGGVVIYFVFWMASRLVKDLILRSSERTRLDPMVVSLMAKTVQVAVIIFGGITALGTLGVNISAVIAVTNIRSKGKAKVKPSRQTTATQSRPVSASTAG